MQPLGYLFIDESEDLQGQVLIKPQFHGSHHIAQLDVIDDWILQLNVLKKNIMNVDPEEK